MSASSELERVQKFIFLILTHVIQIQLINDL